MISDRDIKKGIGIGFAKGFEKGETKGKVEGTVDLIRLILTKHFKTVPQSVQARLLVLTDLQELNKLADFALTAIRWRSLKTH